MNPIPQPTPSAIPLGSTPAADAVPRGAYGTRFEDLSGRRMFAVPGILLVVTALVVATVSFAILLGATPIQPSARTTTALIVVNAFLIACLALLVVYEVWRIVRARRNRRAASRLHVRIISLFSLVAATPAMVVALVAAFTLNQGLDRWFEERTRAIVESSSNIAEAYINENARNLQGTTISLAATLDQAESLFNLDRTGFGNLLTQQARARGLADASLIRSNKDIIVSADIDGDEELPPVPDNAMQAALDGRAVLIPPTSGGYAGTIIRLQRIPDAYLYSIRTVDIQVLGSLRLMEDNMAEYRGLEENRTSTQIAFALLYIGITLVVLLSAIWTGIAVADRLVRPIRYLIHAADAVAGGDLSVSLPVKTSDGDLGAFSNTFNNMIGQLSSQRSALLEANQVIDTRRRFIEAVLSGVTAGIIGVGPDGQITIINRSASALVAGRGGRISGPPLGQALETAIPELADIYRDVVRQKKRSHNASIMITRGGRERTYNVQITMEQSPEAQHSHVITVDDITDLVDAQRSSVWADVARRIAHEIKNPLTPIQLSAERLRRRYGKIVEHDREVFDRCTETIIRQVGDIGRMVDEFSTFARMPKPSPERHDMRAIAREALFLVEVSHAETGFTLEAGEDALFGMYDSRLMGQAIGNLVKNAAEAIEGAVADDAERPKGEIRLRTYRAGDRVVVDVIDNGRGFPAADRNRLLEPYMTTREKGTGLGLAIVRKIVEDHGGTITLMDAPGETGFASGAMVRLSLPMLPVDGAAHDGPAKEPELQNLGV